MSGRLVYLISFVLVLALATSASADLVAHWTFDETSGTVARDSSGNGLDGTLQGDPQWTAGRVGGALDFDGSGDYVDCGNNTLFDITDELTVAAWVNLRSVPGDWRAVIAKGDDAWRLATWGAAQTMNFAWTGAGRDYQNVGSTTALAFGEWYHVCGVYSTADGGRMYINGVEEAFTADILGITTGSYPVYIGDNSQATGRFWDGLIDDLRLYSRALSAAQVQDLFNGIAPIWVKAEKPNPPDGAVGVTTPVLQWQAGETAAWHDVYFGTDPDALEFQVHYGRLQTVYYHQAGVTPGTTYYWRIDEVEADETTIHTGNVWSFTVPALTAWNPDPPDGAKWIPRDVTLSWSAGWGSIMYQVYLSADLDAVTNGTTEADKGMLGTTSYAAEGLDRETTYYWRVDAFDDKGAWHTGDVWSFTTIPEIAITDPHLTGWWRFDEGSGTIALDWSGHDLHATLEGDPQWVPGYDGDALEFDGLGDYVNISYPTDPTVYTITAWVQVAQTSPVSIVVRTSPSGPTTHWSHQLRIQDGTFRHYTYDGSERHVLGTTPVEAGTWYFLAATATNDGLMRLYVNGREEGTATTLGTLWPDGDRFLVGSNSGHGMGWYEGLIDDVRIYDQALSYTEIQQVMRIDPLAAWNAHPSNGALVDIDSATPLSWSPGDNAAQHDVYFGTDKDAVEDADTTTTGIYRGRQDPNTYTPPEGLEWGGGPYYWRIDEFNTDATITTGRVWNFTVANYLIPDDFESYDDYCNRIFYAWKDGWGHSADPDCGIAASLGNGTGSTVGNLNAPFAEQSIVHGGNQSMPFEYNNTGTGGKARYSEASREFATPQNWTRNNVKALTLWFHGETGNTPETLYVAVEDNVGQLRVANHPDPEALQIAAWQQWNIPLTQFSGVNLASVKKLYIGVGNRSNPQAGGSGKLYIDDIRVYPARCVPSLAKPAVDLSNNCIVDYADVEILANQWLDSGFVITPADPGTSGLIGHYPLNGNANDVVGGNNGTTSGIVSYTTGKVGQAILLDGLDDYVGTTVSLLNDMAAFTLAGWVSARNPTDSRIGLFGQNDAIEFGFDGGNVAVWTASGNQRVDATWPFVDVMWHHVAAVGDGTSLNVYIDGELAASGGSTTNNYGTSTYFFNIGGGGVWDDTGNWLSGKIDEVYLYNRALSDGEVAWLAGHTSPISIPADLYQDDVIDFKDIAVLGDSWLEEILWP